MSYTRAQVATLIRQRCDIENTSAQVASEINNHIQDAANYVHDFLIGTYGDKYAVSSGTFSTAAGAATYNLTSFSDLYIPLAVRVTFDDESFPLDSFSDLDRVTRTSGTSWGPGCLPQYRIERSADNDYRVVFDPPPDGAHVVRIRYHTTAPEYTLDTDDVLIPHVDLLIAEACIRVRMKEQRDASIFLGERAAIQKRIEDWVGRVDNGNVMQTLVIPRRRGTHRGRAF